MDFLLAIRFNIAKPQQIIQRWVNAEGVRRCHGEGVFIARVQKNSFTPGRFRPKTILMVALLIEIDRFRNGLFSVRDRTVLVVFNE